MTLASALATGDVARLPSRRDEDWRWSDLRGLLRAIPPASPPGDAAALDAGVFTALADVELVFLNGRPLTASSLHVGPGVRQTVALRFIAQTSNTAHHSACEIIVDAGGILTLLETYEGSGEAYVADAALDIRLAEGARLERIVLAEEPADAIAVSAAEVVLSPRAVFAQTVLTGGARRERRQTRVAHPGRGASARLDGVYLLDGPRHADLTTEVAHDGQGGSTDQLTKGAVRGAARAVFQGRIVVARGADQTDARMGHHGLILSERAEIDAKPELEIYADDVACAHGNTVGALDEEALFYARSRGIPEPEARAMLTAAFVGEVVDRIEHDGAREVARGWVDRKLGGMK